MSIRTVSKYGIIMFNDNTNTYVAPTMCHAQALYTSSPDSVTNITSFILTVRMERLGEVNQIAHSLSFN